MSRRPNEPQDFADLMREHDAELYERGQREIAEELAAFNALPQEERDRLNAESEAKAAAFADALEQAEDDDGEEEDEEDDEEGDDE